MPQINLLAPGSRRREQKGQEAKQVSAKQVSSEGQRVVGPSSTIPTLAFRCAICIGICAVIWIFLAVNLSKRRAALAEIKNEVQSLKVSPEEIATIKKERAALEKKVQLIDALSSREFLWFEKFEVLADLVPDGVWLTRVQSKPKGATQKKSRSSKRKATSSGVGEGTVLVIEGTSVAYKIQDAVALVGDFIRNLQGSDDFARNFTTIKLNNIAKAMIGGLDVMKFDLICETQ